MELSQFLSVKQTWDRNVLEFGTSQQCRLELALEQEGPRKSAGGGMGH